MVTMEEEGLLRCSVIRDIAITCLWVFRVARLIPAYRSSRSAAICGVMLRHLYPALRHVVVAQLCEDRVVAYTRILWIAIRSLLGGYAWGNTKLFIIGFFLRLNLVHALGIVLLAGGDVTAVHAIDVVERACADTARNSL